MDQAQREQFRDKVMAALEAQSLSATAAAKLAGITTTTMTKVTRAQHVERGTVGKLRAALGIPALAEEQNGEGYPPIIEAVRDVVGLILLDVADEELPGRVSRIMAAAVSTGR